MCTLCAGIIIWHEFNHTVNHVQENVFDFAGGKTWYRDVNNIQAAASSAGLFGGLQKRYSLADESKTPILLIHGGPGLSSRYLESMELLCGVGRRVVFYDQVRVWGRGFSCLTCNLAHAAHCCMLRLDNPSSAAVAGEWPSWSVSAGLPVGVGCMLYIQQV